MLADSLAAIDRCPDGQRPRARPRRRRTGLAGGRLQARGRPLRRHPAGPPARPGRAAGGAHRRLPAGPVADAARPGGPGAAPLERGRARVRLRAGHVRLRAGGDEPVRPGRGDGPPRAAAGPARPLERPRRDPRDGDAGADRRRHPLAHQPQRRLGAGQRLRLPQLVAPRRCSTWTAANTPRCWTSTIAWCARKPSQIAYENVDASALLWRLYLRGVDVGDRWQALAQDWAPAVEDGYYAFNDAHAVMAFVGAGRAGPGRAGAGGDGPPGGQRRAGGQRHDDPGRGPAAGPGAGGVLARRPRHLHRSAAGHAPARPPLRRQPRPARRRPPDAARGGAARRVARRLAQALAAERTALKPDSPFNRLLAARARG